MKDPKRLTADDELAELAPDLLAAVRVLRDELPDPEVIARTQRVLETLAPPPPPASKFGFNILVSLSAVVVSAIAFTFLTRQTSEPLPDPTPAPITTSAPAIDPGLTLSPPLTTTTDALPRAETPAPAIPVESPAPPRAARRPSVARSKLPPANPGAATPPPLPPPLPPPTAAAPSESKPEPAQAALARPEPGTRETPQAEAPRAAVAPRVPVAVSEPMGPEPSDEAGLLFRAKRLAPRDPAGALRLLDTHAFYFPNGAFVEEREILAIDLLERVGQVDRARERSARFRARFPKSVYRSAGAP